MSTHKYGIKGREIVAKTQTIDNQTVRISTFGWLYQFSMFGYSAEHEAEMERRHDSSVDLFNKRATKDADGKSVLSYVIETRADNGAPDKTEVYPVRANCPKAFFVEAWSENPEGDEAYGELVGYLKHDGKRWKLLRSYTTKGGKANVDVKIKDGHYQRANVPVCFTSYGLTSDAGKVIPRSCTTLETSPKVSIMKTGRCATDGWEVTAAFDELPKAAQEKAHSDALEIIAEREQYDAEQARLLMESQQKAKRVGQLREIEKLESAFGLAEAGARAAQKELLAARRKLNPPTLPPLPAPTLPKGAALPPLPV